MISESDGHYVIPEKPENDDQRNDLFLNEVKDLVTKSMNSENETERFLAKVFHYSAFKFKSVNEFSKASKIPYRVCMDAYKKYEQRIRQLQWAG